MKNFLCPDFGIVLNVAVNGSINRLTTKKENNMLGLPFTFWVFSFLSLLALIGGIFILRASIRNPDNGGCMAVSLIWLFVLAVLGFWAVVTVGAMTMAGASKWWFIIPALLWALPAFAVVAAIIVFARTSDRDIQGKTK
jgi:hypothetical protein